MTEQNPEQSADRPVEDNPPAPEDVATEAETVAGRPPERTEEQPPPPEGEQQ